MALSWLSWQRVLVVGPSMTPTVRDGDRLLVHCTTRVRAGDVVLATFDSLPDRFVIKRAAYPVDGGWWLTSDNTFAGGDSSVHGVAAVQGRAVLRLPANRRLPRRIRAAAAASE